MIRMPKWLVGVMALTLVVGLTTPVLADEGQGQTVRGQVQQVSAENNQITLQGEDGQQWTFQVGQDARVRVDGRECRLGDLQQGDRATITFQQQGEQRIAQAVRARRGDQQEATQARDQQRQQQQEQRQARDQQQQRQQEERQARGQIQRVSAENNQITLRDQQGRTQRFHIRGDAQVRVGGRESRLADLRQGDQVTVVYQMAAQEVHARRGERSERAERGERGMDLARGQIEEISAENNQIVLRNEDGQQWTLQVGQDARVRVDGRESRLADLRQGDQVTVAYRQQGDQRVAQAVRANRDEHQDAEIVRGQVQQVSADANQITLRDRRGQERTVQVSQGAQVHIDGQEGNLAGLRQGDRVTIIAQPSARQVVRAEE